MAELGSIGELIGQAKRLGIGDRSSKYGVGKTMGDNTWVHRTYEDVFPADVIKAAKQNLSEGFDYTAVRYNRRDGSVAFIQCGDFDTAHEPTVGASCKVSKAGEAKTSKAQRDPLIWHHKWTFVKDDYPGFNVAASVRRSIAWKSKLGKDAKMSSRIGRKSVWESEVVPRLATSTTERQHTIRLLLTQGRPDLAQCVVAMPAELLELGLPTLMNTAPMVLPGLQSAVDYLQDMVRVLVKNTAPQARRALQQAKRALQHLLGLKTAVESRMEAQGVSQKLVKVLVTVTQKLKPGLCSLFPGRQGSVAIHQRSVSDSDAEISAQDANKVGRVPPNGWKCWITNVNETGPRQAMIDLKVSSWPATAAREPMNLNQEIAAALKDSNPELAALVEAGALDDRVVVTAGNFAPDAVKKLIELAKNYGGKLTRNKPGVLMFDMVRRSAKEFVHKVRELDLAKNVQFMNVPGTTGVDVYVRADVDEAFAALVEAAWFKPENIKQMWYQAAKTQGLKRWSMSKVVLVTDKPASWVKGTLERYKGKVRLDAVRGKEFALSGGDAMLTQFLSDVFNAKYGDKMSLKAVEAKVVKAATVKWKDEGGDVHIAEVRLKINGKLQQAWLRIDGRGGKWRCDRLGMMGNIWEAIDYPFGVQGLPNLPAAKKYVQRWVKEAEQQNDLVPRLSR